MTKHSIATACALTLAAALTSTGFAGTEAKAAKEIKETIKESCITGDIGLAVVSEYVSRGVVLENQGFIAEPYLDLYFKLYEGTGFINKVSLNGGLWSSFHSKHTAATPGTSLAAWYEQDWTAGLAITFAKNFTLTTSWFDEEFVSSSTRGGALNVNLAYDDSDLLGAFALHPHATVLKSMIGNYVGVPNGANGWYYEVGIAPGFTVGKGGTYPLTVTIPLTVGLGPETYNGQDYGFFSAGINASVPLAFVPACYGSWTYTTGFTYWNLGENAANASAPAITDGNRNQFVFSGAVGLTF